MGTILAALMAVISLVALAQFALFYWRALMISTAADPLCESICKAVGMQEDSLSGEDFEAIQSIADLCPDLGARGGRASLVRLYYRAIRRLGARLNAHLPSFAAWSANELATCTRYMAVVMGQRLQRNQMLAAQLRSF